MEIDDIYGYDFEIIDIREESEYNLSHLDNSRNIVMPKLLINYENILKKNKNYLLICSYGIQSKVIMNMLNRLGYHIFSLKDGYTGLKRRGKVKR